MIMRYIEKKMEKESRNGSSEVIPYWVSEKNASLSAWRCAESLKKARILYIKTHSKVSDFVKKNNYKIKASEIAKTLNINRSTLMHTSSYSRNFSEYIQATNAELESMKSERLVKRSRASSRGSISDRKDELLQLNKELKRRIAELERLTVEKVVKQSIDKLPLPTKKKLGLV